MAKQSISNYHTKYKNIIEAAADLTGSKAQTKAGAWKALREKHLPKLQGEGLRKKTGYNYLAENGVWCNKTVSRNEYYQKHWQLRAERGANKIMRSMGLNTRWENIQNGGIDPWEKDIHSRKRNVTRGTYGELYNDFVDPATWFKTTAGIIANQWLASQDNLSAARKCIQDVEKFGADEHGGWEQRSSWDSKGRGESISVDIYGTDTTQNLHVIQVRQSIRAYKNGYLNIRKSYFLIGYNENENPFAHPVESRMVHAAIKKDPAPEYVVSAAQAWIWGIPVEKLPLVLRNGDTAMIPSKTPPKTAEVMADSQAGLRLIDSHILTADSIIRNGSLYAKNPTINHLKNQHPTITGKGWYKIMVGNRADYHSFARPTID